MAPPSPAPAAALFLAALLVLSASPASAARPRSSSKVAAGPHDIPAVFAFGDSTLDPGNNNRLFTVVRADHAPYGRAFPAGVPPSGRFSDGKLITDYIVAALGIKDLLPAYHASGVTHADATTGASFASGGSGLDDITAHAVMVSTFSSQIADFQQLLSRIGEPQAADIAAKSLFILSAGTNDVTMNYYDLPFRALQYPTIDAYHDYLISCYQSYIQVRSSDHLLLLVHSVNLHTY
uniref:GDSL esterase/lipase n=1 Tax=Triticum urartu TaxID=4572 RepID=A0A8R7P4A6_TRIUA